MRTVLCSAAILAAASVSYAAGVPARGVSGNYIEARTADVYTGPCFANGEVDINGKEAVLGWKINNGQWRGVDISGLSVVAAVRSEHTLGNVYEADNPTRAVLVIDSRASAAQRVALRSFAQSMAGDILKNIVKVDYQPIELTIENNNIHGGAAKLTAGSLAEVSTRAMAEADHTCGNEDIYYPPLSKVDHVMPAYALADSYSGKDLGATWDTHYGRSGFLATFQVPAE